MKRMTFLVKVNTSLCEEPRWSAGNACLAWAGTGGPSRTPPGWDGAGGHPSGRPRSPRQSGGGQGVGPCLYTLVLS